MKTTEQRILDYSAKGLTSSEIGKLLDLSTRTIQRYLREEKDKQQPAKRTRVTKALELHAAGYSYSEIARKLKVSKTTVYLWHRKNVMTK